MFIQAQHPWRPGRELSSIFHRNGFGQKCQQLQTCKPTARSSSSSHQFLTKKSWVNMSQHESTLITNIALLYTSDSEIYSSQALMQAAQSCPSSNHASWSRKFSLPRSRACRLDFDDSREVVDNMWQLLWHLARIVRICEPAKLLLIQRLTMGHSCFWHLMRS